MNRELEVEDRNMRKPLLMVFLTIVILYFVSYMPAGTTVVGIELKAVDITSDLKAPQEESENNFNYEKMLDDDFWNSEDDTTILENTKLNKAEFGIFSYAAGLFGESGSKNDNLKKSSSVANQIKQEKITGNVKQLKPFFDALNKAKKRKVRIAHYGDSIIGGDLITQDIRDELQAEFGGSAPGFLAIASKDIKFRMTTKHSFPEKDWKTVRVFSNLRRAPIGINTNVYTPKGKTWVEYETTPHYKRLDGYNEAVLFYSDAKPSSIQYKYGNEKAKFVKLDTSPGLHTAKFKSGKKEKKLHIDFSMKDQANIFGVSLEAGNGIYVDNFPMQGRSGASLEKIPVEEFQAFNKELDYKLIILQFGLNVIGKIERTAKKYQNEMVSVVKHLQKAFPNTGILLVGVNDKGFKKGQKITTDPSVKKLLAVQMGVVKKTNIAFWNLFEAMGGENSMQHWVKANPPLAWGDYTHFNNQGAKKVAKLLSEALIEASKKN